MSEYTYVHMVFVECMLKVLYNYFKMWNTLHCVYDLDNVMLCVYKCV